MADSLVKIGHQSPKILSTALDILQHTLCTLLWRTPKAKHVRGVRVAEERLAINKRDDEPIERTS